jgi:hypothetical protein
LHRIPHAYVPIVHRAVARLAATGDGVSVYLYGSVATGTAHPPHSDVDLLTVGLDPDVASTIGRTLSDEFADRCRGVEVAAAMPGDLEGEGDEAYGGRVFLHHYCVHLAGPDVDRARHDFPADRRAARGFNGDVAQQARRWREQLGQVDSAALGRRVARKTLLAVAGLVSIHDGTWTTDREYAAGRWGEIHPELESPLDKILGWAAGDVPDTDALAEQLDTTVSAIVLQFADDIGLWHDTG